jgi:hypothetical protein
MARSVTVGEEIQRFELLYTRFRTKRVLTRQSEMMNLLLQLSGEGKINQTSPSNIVSNVFTNKSLNKVDYTAAK